MNGPVLTSREAAKHCGIALQTLYNLISRGEAPNHFKRGRRLAFYVADLDEWNRATLRAQKREEEAA